MNKKTNDFGKFLCGKRGSEETEEEPTSSKKKKKAALNRRFHKSNSKYGLITIGCSRATSLRYITRGERQVRCYEDTANKVVYTVA